MYIQQLAALLLQANGDQLSPAGLQTTAVMQKASLMFCSKARLNPLSLRECVANKKSPSVVAVPPAKLTDGAWRGIADAMCLSKDQHKQLMQVRRLYLLRQGQLLRGRREIISKIQVGVRHPDGLRCPHIPRAGWPSSRLDSLGGPSGCLRLQKTPDFLPEALSCSLCSIKIKEMSRHCGHMTLRMSDCWS